MATPPAVPPVADANRYVLYAINGVATTFVGVPFPIYGDASDLTVVFDGIIQPPQNYSLVSASGSPLSALSQPITDGQIYFSPNCVCTNLEIIGSIHPRQLAMPTTPGIARREWNQVVGQIVSTLRELWRQNNLDISQPFGFDASGPLSGRTNYDSQVTGFRYAQTDYAGGAPVLYVKNSANVADWSQALFFRGAAGSQGATGSGTVSSVGSSFGLTGGPITATGSLAVDPTQFGWGLRNRLMNGAMAIDQRNSGAAYTLGTGSGVTNYSVDRWAAILGAAGTGITSQQVSVKTGGVNFALRLQRALSSSTTSVVNLVQPLETSSNIDLQGQPVTLSFKARAGANFSPTSQQISASIITGTGTDQGAAALAANTWTGQATAATATPTLTTSFQTSALNATLPAGATQIGVAFSFTPTGTAGAADYMDITDVQLEYGTLSAAQIAVERRPQQVELSLCQRFYEKLKTSMVFWPFSYSSVTAFWSFKVTKRAAPTVTVVTGTFQNQLADVDFWSGEAPSADTSETLGAGSTANSEL